MAKTLNQMALEIGSSIGDVGPTRFAQMMNLA